MVQNNHLDVDSYLLIIVATRPAALQVCSNPGYTGTYISIKQRKEEEDDDAANNQQSARAAQMSIMITLYQNPT
jgi:hypothetical protein